VDPHGSIIAYPDTLNTEGVHSYKVEGIGYDFIPKNCDRVNSVDKWVKTHDKESFLMARRLIREEGLMVGGSSGSCLVAALQIAQNLPEDKRVVVMFVDGIRNYMSKFLNDDWMLENEYINQDEYDKLQQTSDGGKVYGGDNIIADLNLPVVYPLKENTTTILEAIEQFAKQKQECLPVIDDFGVLVGMITYKQISSGLSSFKIGANNFISSSVNKEFKRLKYTDSIKYASRAFTRHSHVLVLGDQSKYHICEPKHVIKHFLSNKN